jgi:Tfp pilus assembly protein PilO
MKKILSELLGIGEWNKDDKIFVLLVIGINITVITLAFIIYE